MNKDIEHLNLLKIFHYVVGGVGCFFSCFPLIHVALGLLIATGNLNSVEEMSDGPPQEFGWFFVFIGGLFFLMGQAVCITIILSGKFIAQRKNYLFTFIIACIACIGFPFGTLLGVFTIIVLSRDSVKELYNNHDSPEA